jgi:tRNA(Arg) A34 adenosine deaminase TadA
MRRAIELSRELMESGAGSWCASIVVKDGEIIGQGANTVVETNDPVAHCEINAMHEACERLGTWDLSGCELYTTWEPCPMCAAAIWLARIDRVYYANLLSDAERFGMNLQPLVDEIRLDSEERSRPYQRLLGDEALAVVLDWAKRKEPELMA